MSVSVLNDALFASMGSSILSLDQAESLPPACYVDEEFFAFEKEAIFDHEWLCVGRESWAKNPGDYFTAMHVNEPIVVVRNREGVLKAMSSVCQHRGMLVAEGHGTVKTFLCPYHHWAYSLDGELVGTPAMDRTCNFDAHKFGLPQFKVEVWQGFVFVNFDLDAPALAPRLKAVDAAIANFDLANLDGPRPEPPMRLPWNWKVMFENNNDGYHANRLHKGPLHDFIPSNLASFPDMPAETAGYLRFNGTLHADAAFNATQKALLPIFPKLTDAERNRVVFVNVPPTLSLVMTTDSVIYLMMQAETANQHSMGFGTLVAPGAMSNPLFGHLLEMGGRAVMEIVAQDQHVDEMVQIGLRSRFAPRGRYSWQEGAQRQLNVWLVERYRKAWARRRGARITAPAAE
ncbi:MAG: aromatic ring-hydroxylating dioxygenase subunit alpha [Rhodospirillaceae bacterium]|nr:aromatic ring-hydroxylating dioxygenase subunit alpha [Rhodospirillaceae bacterium]